MRSLFTLVFLFSFFLNFSQSGVDFKEKASWIKTVDVDYKASLPKSEISNGSFYLFYDEQYNLINHSKYYHYAYKVVSDIGVQNNSELVFNYNPIYEKFCFNSISIIRNGERINYKNLVKISTAKREQNLEYSQIDASLSVIVVFQGIRAGDIIEYDYTQEGLNPIFYGKGYVKLYFNSDIRLLNIYYRVVVDTANGFRIKYQNKVYLPTKTTHTKSVKDLEWTYTNLEKITVDDNYPRSLTPYSIGEITQYNSWEEVEKWASQLFDLTANPSEELTNKIDELVATKKTEEEKVISIIRFVQDKVRYFGIEIGVNSHLPQKPSITFKRRFGDCKDKSILMCYMLNKIGVKAYPVLIGTDLRKSLENYLPSPHLFNHLIVCFYFENKKYFVDATISNQGGNLEYLFCPDYQKGIVVDNESYGLDDIISNDYSSIVVKEQYDVKSYTDTNVVFTVETKFAGDEADNTRAYFLNNSLDEIHVNYLNFYNTYYSKIEVVDSVSYEDDLEKNIFTVYEKYRIGDFWKRDDTLKNKKVTMTFRAANISNFLNKYNTNKTKRTSPSSLFFPVHYKQHTIINTHVPWKLDYDEQEINTDYLFYKFSPTSEGKVIHLTWELKTLKDVVPVKDYSEFVKSLSTIEKYIGYEFTKDLSLPETDLDAVKKGLHINWPTLYYFIFLLLLFSFLFTKFYVAKLTPESVLESQTIDADSIGGWLVLPIIGLVISPFLHTYNLFSGDNFSKTTWDTFSIPGYGIWKIIIVYQITVITFFICAGILLTVMYFTKDKRLPKCIVIYYAALILFNVSELLFCFLLEDAQVRDETLYAEGKALLRSVVGGAIWIPYFIFSERVKRTFLK